MGGARPFGQRVSGLVVELGACREAVQIREALRRALGDPSLDLAYWIPAEGGYVDPDGRPIRLPQLGEERVSTVVERAGEPVAALVHDPALHENASLVDSVCAAAALTLQNERLRAELRGEAGGATSIPGAAAGGDGVGAPSNRA